jgi:hypothetical protein
MSKKTLAKWGLLVTGSTFAALQLGACLADFVLQQLILTAVN